MGHERFSAGHGLPLRNMSLKAFHLIFVTLLTALSFGCAAWAFQSGCMVWGVMAIAAGLFVIVYGLYFLKKLKNVSYL